MSIKFPQIAGRQTKGPQPRNSHRQRYRWHAELRRQALEAATGRVVDLLARVRLEFPRVAHSFPRFEDHDDPAMQSAYREALGPLPKFEPLRVGFRISECLTRLRMEAARGVGDIAGIADPARF